MIAKVIISLQILLLTFWAPNPLTCGLQIKITPIYDSLALMEELLKTQVIVRKNLELYRGYIQQDRHKRRLFDDLVSRCVREEEIAARIGAEKYLHNPINTFNLIMRLSKDLANVEELLDDTEYERKEAVYPNKEDLDGSVEEFTRLQLLYDLDPFLLANGTLVNPFNNETRPAFDQVSPMTADDCYELALVEYDKNDRSRNIAWLAAALNKLKRPKDDMIVPKSEVLGRLAGECYHMGQIENTVYYLEESISVAPFKPENREKRKVIEVLKRQISQKASCGDVYNFNLPVRPKKDARKLQDGAYPGLCVKKTKSYINPRLKCFHKHGPHGFLKLAPTRIELLSESPLVMMFHDIITDAEAQELRSLARARLSPAPLMKLGPKKEISYCRHQLAWISDDMSPIVARLSRKISRVTALNVNSLYADDFQVANYGLGGYYGPHYDFIRPINSTSRIEKTYATILSYLTDVEEGGATIFTELNITVYPRKNSALFWLSLDAAGTDDYRTQHAACPALYGNRWVASKWIALAGQELVRPCPAILKMKIKPKVSRRKIRM